MIAFVPSGEYADRGVWRIIRISGIDLSAGQGIMTRKRNPNARTTPALRREIQQSGESNRALAVRLGLNPKTIAKWHGRRTVSDARMGPKHPVSTVLNAAEEALIIAFRKHTRLPLNECWACLKPMIPSLSRSALHRCLKRYGVSRVPKGQRQKLPEMEDRKDYGHFAIEIHALPGEAGEYLYTAISGVKRLVFAKVLEGASVNAALGFLAELIKHAPVKVQGVETNNYRAFANPDGGPRDPEHPSMFHPFYKACVNNKLFHHITKSEIPAPRMVSKGWARVPMRRREKPRRSRSSIEAIVE
jgi:hypothetical protein